DLVTVAKGLTSAYAPLSGVIVGERVWEVIARGSREHGPMGHGWTYSGHPVCAAAALANLDILERENLAGNAAEVGAYFGERLREQFGAHPLVMTRAEADEIVARVKQAVDQVADHVAAGAR
uniref:aminotransferase class III-fold pyridoxal phosphate-dependent enzyme n=1 Tax=Paraburkholderia bryophila TaxID=420952 RepID=UPI001592EE9B